MFDGLEEIDWDALGSPGIPALFQAIEADADDAEDAEADLFHILCEHYDPPLMASVLPFLVEAVGETRLSTRRDLSDTLWRLTRSLEWLSNRWIRAWSAAAPTLFPLLDDEDGEVRGNVLAALASAPDDDGTVSAELRRRWAHSGRDGAVLPQLDLAMAIVKLDEAEPDDPVRQWLARMLDDPDSARRLGAAAALLVAVPDDVRAAQTEMADGVRRGDVLPWERTDWLGEQGPSAADWASGRTNRRAEQDRGTLERLEAADDEERTRAASDAALLVASWPSTEHEVLPALARHLDDPCAEARGYAMHALAACGTRSVPFADRIAERVTDTAAAGPHTKVTIGDLAVWALVRAGDRRCVPLVLSWLDGSGRTTFDDSSRVGGDPHSYALDMPALHEVLETARPFAADLLPAARARLRASSDYGRCREMARIAESWGEVAAPAVPELVDLLSTDAGEWASRALATMGPAAADAAPALRLTFERRRLRPLPGRFRRAHLPWRGRPERGRDAVLRAAWAYWHVSGDADAALPTLARGLDNGGEGTALRCLGDVGAHAPRTARRVRDFIESEDPHQRIHAARAYARLTGEPDEAVRVLTETLRPIADAELVPPLKWVAVYIAETGPPAAGTVPLMRAALELDVRLNSCGSWRAIDADQKDRHSLAAAIAAVTG